MLRTGKPGSSFAFEIARKIGFQEEVLERAASITGYSQIDFEKQLQELETEKMQLEKEREKFGVADDFMSETIDKYEKLISDLTERKSDIIEDARREAGEILSGANKLIEHTIKGIREAEAEKEKTTELRKKLKAEKNEILTKKEERKPKSEKRKSSSIPEARRPKPEAQNLKSDYLPGVPEVGDAVEIITYGTKGEVVEIKGKKSKVSNGTITIEVLISDLKKISGYRLPIAGHRKSVTYSNISNEINQKAAHFNARIDLRGKRAVEALDDLKRYIDDAILLSAKEVSILHGKGDGILRNVLREYLQTIDDVEQISDAHVERGGQGITIVKLR